MPPVRLEPTIPASARLQTYALDRAATGIGSSSSNNYPKGLRDASVCIATRCGLEVSGFEPRWWARDFLFSKTSRPTSVLCIGYRGSLPAVKWPARGVDHPTPSSAEGKNEWNYTSTPPLWLHGMLHGDIYIYMQIHTVSYPRPC
jgi:hypothetical protein